MRRACAPPSSSISSSSTSEGGARPRGRTLEQRLLLRRFRDPGLRQRVDGIFVDDIAAGIFASRRTSVPPPAQCSIAGARIDLGAWCGSCGFPSRSRAVGFAFDTRGIDQRAAIAAAAIFVSRNRRALEAARHDVAATVRQLLGVVITPPQPRLRDQTGGRPSQSLIPGPGRSSSLIPDQRGRR